MSRTQLGVNGSEGRKAVIPCVGEVTSNSGDDEEVERSEYEVNDEGRYGGKVEHELQRRLKLAAYELWDGKIYVKETNINEKEKYSSNLWSKTPRLGKCRKEKWTAAEQVTLSGRVWNFELGLRRVPGSDGGYPGRPVRRAVSSFLKTEGPDYIGDGISFAVKLKLSARRHLLGTFETRTKPISCPICPYLMQWYNLYLILTCTNLCSNKCGMDASSYGEIVADEFFKCAVADDGSTILSHRYQGLDDSDVNISEVSISHRESKEIMYEFSATDSENQFKLRRTGGSVPCSKTAVFSTAVTFNGPVGALVWIGRYQTVSVIYALRCSSTWNVPAHFWDSNTLVVRFWGLTLPSENSVCSVNVKLSVTASFPYDLVLGGDWLFFCSETLLHASLCLSSGIFHPRQRPTALSSHSAHPAPNPTAIDTGTQISVTEPSLPAFAMGPWLAAVHLHSDLCHQLYS
ncbi:hypothetical protein B0H19DRAFT_1340791 [Mycena capillaripes]|nr:hypothetical protein B0H19DRAFT_1340791 [Mycena capillaripes]